MPFTDIGELPLGKTLQPAFEPKQKVYKKKMLRKIRDKELASLEESKKLIEGVRKF